MAFYDDQADPYGALGQTVSHPRRPAPPPSGAPRPLIAAAPPMATPQAPGQDASSYGSANSSNANADRTRTLTPLDAQGQDLQNRLRQLELERQGRTADQQYTREQNIADLNSMGERLQRVGNLYNQNFREQDPWISFGLSDNEHQFDSAANMLRQQAQGAFRNIGSGTVSDYDAQLLERAYGLGSQRRDADNEEILNGLQERMNQRRAAVGLPPVDWRVTPPGVGQVGQQIVGAAVEAPLNPQLRATNAPGQITTTDPRESGQAAGVVQQPNQEVSGNVAAGTMYAGPMSRQFLSEFQDAVNAGATREQLNQLLAHQWEVQIQAYHYLQRFYPGMNLERPIPATMPDDQWRLIEEGRRRGRNQQFGPNPVDPQPGSNTLGAAADTDFGSGVANFADAMSGGLAGLADPNYSRRMEGLRANHPVSSTIGQIAGSVAPSMAIERGMGAAFTRAGVGMGERDLMRNAPRIGSNAIYGGITGMSGNPDDRLGGFVTGAAGGAAMGEAGAGASRFVGSAIGGVRNAGARYLSDRRVPLTPGQIMRESEGPVAGFVGPALARAEEALSSVSPTGARFRDSWRGAQNAAHDEALSTLPNAAANRGARTGEELMQDTDNQIGQAYRQVLQGVNLQADRTFTRRSNAIMSNAQRPAIPAEQRAVLGDTFRQIGELFQNGNLSGERYQAARQIIKDARSAIRNMPLSSPGLAVLRDTERNLGNMASRQQPGFATALGRVDAAYRRASILRDAQGRAVNSENGTISPGQLGTAARQGTRRYGGNAQAVSTRRPFYALQDAVRSVLPNRVADSGTAMRLAVPAAILGGGATADQFGWTDNSLRNAAIVAGLYTRPGQQFLQSLLIRRPNLARQIGDVFASPTAQRVGSHLARGGLLPPYLDSTDR